MPKFTPVIRTVVFLVVLAIGLVVLLKWKDSTTLNRNYPSATFDADMFDQCVNCETGRPPCLNAVPGRYATQYPAVGTKSWACCPNGYAPDLIKAGQNAYKVICVPVPPKKVASV